MSDLNENNKEQEMSFLNHLEELRWRLVKASIAIIVIAIVLFIFTEPIIENVYVSMTETNFPTYRFFCWLSQSLGMGDALCAAEIQLDLQSTTMTGQFNTNMYFSIVGGIIISFPFIFYQLWGFVKPALRQRELSASKGVVWSASALFLLGVSFGYYIISPLCVQFFGNYTMANDIQNIFTINSYLSLITTTTLLAGVFFELPVVVYLMTKLGILSPEFLRRYRKHAIVIVLILSALITPPDVISQVLVAIPIMGLYELGIYVSKLVIKEKNESKA